MPTAITTEPATDYKIHDGLYRFPFTVLDGTPGRASLGRIEWNVEPIWAERELSTDGEYRLIRLLVWARQTRDARYAGRFFEIPCNSEGVQGHRQTTKPQSFTDYVWLIGFCSAHKMPIFSAYPENRHSILEVNVSSGLAVDVFFLAE